MKIDNPEIQKELEFDVAITSASASNNSLFRDSADNVIKRKDNSGVVAPVSGSSEPIFYNDASPSTGNSTTTETDVLTITINQNDLGSNATLDVSGIVYVSSDETRITYTMRLYVDGVEEESYTHIFPLDGTDTGIRQVNVPLKFLKTGVDTTLGNVIVKISIQPSVSLAPSYGFGGKNLVVRGYE